jgi:small-conductance mechanosensitive channel
MLRDLAPRAITNVIRLRSLLGDVHFADEVATDLLAEKSGWRGWLRARVLNPAKALVVRANDWLSTSLFRIGEAPVTVYGLLRIALFLLLAVVASRVVRMLINRFGTRESGHSSAGLYTVGRLAHYVLIAAALLIGLASIGLDFSQLALVAGALSIGIGFGLQSIVNNFVSGLMILFEQNLKVGDVVELDSGVRGVVKEINVRSTLITTSDAVDVVVPNAEFISGKVTNFTLRDPTYRIHVPFGVAYGSDKDVVRQVVIEAAEKVPFTHRTASRQTDVWLVKFGDNSLDFELVVWINPTAVTRPGAVVATYLWEIETALASHGIAIPFPQRDVRVRLSSDDVATLVRSNDAASPAR